MWPNEKATVVEITDERNFHFSRIFYILVRFWVADLKVHSLQFVLQPESGDWL
jgi:hypothetical protein